MSTYKFDRFLKYDEMVVWLHDVAARFPGLMTLESYGKSHQGRDLWLATITDTSTGAHNTKPAQWIDANIHSVELIAGVAACYIIEQLLTRFGQPEHAHATEALRTRTFYISPRVNPDGVEDALLDSPKYHRSSTRMWPYKNGKTDPWPGLIVQDVDGDGAVRTMRIPDPDGAWVEHDDEPRVMVGVGPLAPAGKQRYRLLDEGLLANYDGFTIGLPRDPSGLDLNRNFPAGWGNQITGSGDYPLSEPEIAFLVKAVRARPNVCGYNAFHSSGGVMLRPSSTKSDSALPPFDVWAYKEMAKHSLETTGYLTHSCFDDFTWDKTETMSGASDDWAYEHMGVFSWTTEFWDIIFHATGTKSPTDVWYIPPPPLSEVAVCKWTDIHNPGSYAPWKAFDHPQLGAIEVGGCNYVRTWSNPPPLKMVDEVSGHVDFAVFQALCSPRLEIKLAEAQKVGEGLYNIRCGIANTGWFNTTVTKHAEKNEITLPVTAHITATGQSALEFVSPGEAPRVKLGQLDGRSKFRVNGDNKSDGSPDRCMHSWMIRGKPGQQVTLTASHERAGTATVTISLP